MQPIYYFTLFRYDLRNWQKNALVIHWNKVQSNGETLFMKFIKKKTLTTDFLFDVYKSIFLRNPTLVFEYIIKYQPEHIILYFYGIYRNRIYSNYTNKLGQSFPIQCLVHKKFRVYECLLNEKTDWNTVDYSKRNLAMYLLKYTKDYDLLNVSKINWNVVDGKKRSVLEYLMRHSTNEANYVLENVLSSGLPLIKLTNIQKHKSKFMSRVDLDLFSERCVICLDHFKKYGEFIFKARCGHVFHIHCIKNEYKCPLCRQPFG